MSYIILDLDNTISDDRWRIPKINWDESDPTWKYNAYHLLAGFDKSANEHIWRDRYEDVAIFTARPEFYAPIAEHWLKEIGLNVCCLLMRPNGDHSSSPYLKRMQLELFYQRMKATSEDVAFAYDDRQDVCDMYIANGINAHCISIHKVDATKKPNLRVIK